MTMTRSQRIAKAEKRRAELLKAVRKAPPGRVHIMRARLYDATVRALAAGNAVRK